MKEGKFLVIVTILFTAGLFSAFIFIPTEERVIEELGTIVEIQDVEYGSWAIYMYTVELDTGEKYSFPVDCESTCTLKTGQKLCREVGYTRVWASDSCD